MASIQKTILDATQTALTTLLAGRGYSSDNIRIRRRSTLDSMASGKKCVISQSPERYTGDEATNEQDDVGYGVLITLAHAGNADPEYSDNFDDLLTDREAVRRHFHNDTSTLAMSLPAGCFFVGLKVEPGPMLMLDHSLNNIDATALVLRVIVRETHG